MSPQLSPSEESTVSQRSSVAASAGLGVFAAAIGYLLTYLLVASEVREAVGDNVAEWKAVAWFFYEAHMVGVEVSGQIGSFAGMSTLDLIAQSDTASATLLYVVPPVVLFAAGALLAVRWDVSDLGEAVVVGAPVTIGYAVVMGLGALATESTTETSALGIEASSSIAPALLPAIVLGGVLYPLVFATAGAAIAAAVATR
ncbi:hypothetical protein ACFR99_16420 [Haloarchaeobius amylolyticus]|uniref:DUF7978 domain-containing protein n=1 Tax=Haloarchaeobius amylolyticus TaxID=1198296 RepID=A0ABD6BJ40_9EURY